MAQIVVNITLKRPPEEVFFAIVDDRAHARWSSAMRTQASDGPVGVGTTYDIVGRSLGREFQAESKVIEFQANRRFAMAASAPFPAVFDFSLTPVDGGTRVDETLDAHPGGFLRLVQPLLLQMLKRQMQGDLETLRDLIESGAL